MNMLRYKIFLTTSLLLMLSGCNNPGGVSDETYEKYKRLASPKILYSCATLATKLSMNFEHCIQNPKSSQCTGDLVEKDAKIGYVAGVGALVTYNQLLGDLEKDCSGELKRLRILESAK